jgi:hypothetical protein
VLENIAKVEAGLRTDEAGGTEPLSAEEMLGLFGWLVTHNAARAPSEVETTTKWHRFQAQAAEMASNWFAARFHLDRLIALEPADRNLITRRDRALSAWEASRHNHGLGSASSNAQ